MAEVGRLSERLRSPTLAALVGLACAAGTLLFADRRQRQNLPPPRPTSTFAREEQARLERSLAEIRAPLDRVVTPAETRRWIDDAFTGWSGPAVEVSPGPLVEGFSGQYRLYRLQGTCALDKEEDLVRRLLAIEGAPRWLSGSRVAGEDSVAWKMMLAFRAGPQWQRAWPVRPGRQTAAPSVERLTPSSQPSRGRPIPGVPARTRPAPPGPFAVPLTLDLADPWTSRVGEVSAAMGSTGRSPVESVVAEGRSVEAPKVRLERTLVSPGRPWACYAIFDGRLVRPGDSVGGMGIRAILPDRVLMGEGKPIELRRERGK